MIVDGVVLSECAGDSEIFKLRDEARPRGFRFGFMHRCHLATLEIDQASVPADITDRFSAVLATLFPTRQFAASLVTGQSDKDAAIFSALAIAQVAEHLQSAGGIPIAGPAKILFTKRHRDDDQRHLVHVGIAVPSLFPRRAAAALSFSTKLASALLREAQGALPPSLEAEFTELMASFGQAVPQSGNNSSHLLQAALQIGLPIAWLPHGIMQLGWGKKARLFGSIATDCTSLIGMLTAKNKLATAALMRSANIPVPLHESVSSAQAAVDAANRIGFPVVVKPSNLDRGEGVTANIADEAGVRRAYQGALEKSAKLMVEKHIHGAEYRLLVVNGRLFWAYERVPAHVYGDGFSTIQVLVDQTNRTRSKEPPDGLGLREISIDAEVHAILLLQGQTLGSIPAAGTYVRLRQVPLVKNGGEVVPVLDHVHPDNVTIAERAARLMRLDIAGIDLLIGDISRSWRETGGAITEVNALPQFSPLSRPDIFRALLAELVPGNGRIPTSLVIGGNIEQAVAQLGSHFLKAGIVAGIVSDNSILIGTDEISRGKIDIFDGVQMVISDPTVEAMVVVVEGTGLIQHGFPIDRFDLVAVAGGIPASDLRALLSSVKLHYSGDVLVLNDPVVRAEALKTMIKSKLFFSDTWSLLIEKIAATIFDHISGSAKYIK